MSHARTIGTPAALSLALGAAGVFCAPAPASPATAARVAAGLAEPDARPDAPPAPRARGEASRTAGAAARLVVFVHDQAADTILRLQDLNADGDAHDPGEATVFYDDSPAANLGIDNAQGLVALDTRTLLATDNFAPDNVVLLTDLDENGTALDPGEAAVWFAGALPGGFALTNPADLTRRPDGSYFILDNNTLDTANPEAIYVLDDLNADGDVDDPGEVTLFHELSPVGVSDATTFDVVQDNSGNVYVFDIDDPDQIESIDIIDPAGAARSEWLDSAALFANTNYLFGSSYELAHNPATDEIIFGCSTLSGDQTIMAGIDLNASGTINSLAEIRVLWQESVHADGFNTGSPRDFVLTPDGRLLWTDALQDRVMLLRDLNADGDFQDAGETVVLYDEATAVANGLPTLELPLSIAAALVCAADCDGSGLLNVDDVDCFAAAFLASDLAADCDGNGLLNVDDIDCFATSFLAGCP